MGGRGSGWLAACATASRQRTDLCVRLVLSISINLMDERGGVGKSPGLERVLSSRHAPAFGKRLADRQDPVLKPGPQGFIKATVAVRCGACFQGERYSCPCARIVGLLVRTG